MLSGRLVRRHDEMIKCADKKRLCGLGLYGLDTVAVRSVVQVEWRLVSQGEQGQRHRSTKADVSFDRIVFSIVIPFFWPHHRDLPESAQEQ